VTHKEKDHYLCINFAMTAAGGRRYTPDNDLGLPDLDNPFGASYKDYFRADIKVSFHQNFKTFSHDIALDLRNIFNTRNVFERYYDPNLNDYQYTYQIGFLPLLTYEIGF